MNVFRYQLEKYRGRGSRYVCPQCGRKYAFTRYVDTHNNNEYVGEKVGKCNRLDKCGYHYTPKQYFEDNPWLRDKEFSFFSKHRVFERKKIEKPEREPYGAIPRWFMEQTLGRDCGYKQWLRTTFGGDTAERLIAEYYIGGNAEGDAVFWQVDHNEIVRTGKIMSYDPATGKRHKGEEAYLDWVHSVMQRGGILPEGWRLRQCLYGEHLLKRRPEEIVAVAEGAKTAHVGSALMPDMVWVAVDSMLGITPERLEPLKGRKCIFFADEGRGYEEWKERLGPIAYGVGFQYLLSDFVQEHALLAGGDIADMIGYEELEEP